MWMQKRRVFAEKHGASGPGGPQIDGVSTHPNQLVCFILENLSIPFQAVRSRSEGCLSLVSALGLQELP